ncbi:MAG: hypothetical protein LBK95_13415 [Bifidobacteriaceae bacterium]|nr:hypothetical protein [Bifidobacteriaceae bacterium]
MTKPGSSQVRKAVTATLEKQGLRVHAGDGSHYWLYQAIRAQVGTNALTIITPFNRMRQKRHQFQYDSSSRIVEQDLDDDLPKARRIVSSVRLLSERLGQWEFPKNG